MRHLIRRFSRVADIDVILPPEIGESELAKEGGGVGLRAAVPTGHVPVYVGENMERFSVSADLLNHPIFVELLNRSAQEYGYEQKGVLHIPCHALLFQRLLDALRSGHSSDALDLVLHHI